MVGERKDTIGEGLLPVVSHKFGNVLISMSTRIRVELRELASCGRPKMQGRSLPSELIECLVIWSKEAQQFSKSGDQKEIDT
jgi:hypothetical protein